MTDLELIQLMAANNKAVIEFVFYDKCMRLWGYISREIFSNRIEKDELISELYLYLRHNDWQRIKEFQGRSKFTTWLSVVAVRYFLKKRASITNNGIHSPLTHELQQKKHDRSLPEEMAQRIDLIQAISRLKSPRDRYVILSMEIEGREADDVALELNISKANLYNVKKRAYEKLSKLLTDYEYADQ